MLGKLYYMRVPFKNLFAFLAHDVLDDLSSPEWEHTRLIPGGHYQSCKLIKKLETEIEIEIALKT